MSVQSSLTRSRFLDVTQRSPKKTAARETTFGANRPVSIAFSHDVTAAILVSQNNETAAMLVSQTGLKTLYRFRRH